MIPVNSLFFGRCVRSPAQQSKAVNTKNDLSSWFCAARKPKHGGHKLFKSDGLLATSLVPNPRATRSIRSVLAEVGEGRVFSCGTYMRRAFPRCKVASEWKWERRHQTDWCCCLVPHYIKHIVMSAGYKIHTQCTPEPPSLGIERMPKCCHVNHNNQNYTRLNERLLGWAVW